jgi:oxygen-independent coproporphyrinogen-3 oxidase
MIAASDLLASSPYVGYSYAYPHKTAYRGLEPPVALDELWTDEARDALFLYIHIPFCEMRCGFCNLFTQARPQDGLVASYLQTLERQARRVARALGPVQFARCAVGGGTPTQLDAADLARLCELAGQIMGADFRTIPVSIEASPETTTPEKLAVLAARGVTRLSLGVQTFVEAEAHAVGRPQKTPRVLAALDAIRAAGFPVLNIDLIYGLPGQTLDTWLESLRQALRFRPEELYLYPLYVRPLTGLGRSDKEWDDIRLLCYRAGRALLLDEGYEQVSMRMFQREKGTQLISAEGCTSRPVSATEMRCVPFSPVYCCQEDGMVGLGCGARSYTRSLHYSTEYAVGARGVREIIAAYIARPDESFDRADYGFRLDEDEQRRRYLIQSLLTRDGLDPAAYRRRFGSSASDDFPELNELEALGLVETAEGWRLTDEGLERSDVIGPWLYSPVVQQRMEEYSWR